LSVVDYAKAQLQELEKTCTTKEDLKAQKQINKSILKMLKVFAAQGHSGFSAGCALNIFNRLVKFKPLVPLQGTDDEWEPGHNGFPAQNKKCSSVFKYDDGTCYDIDAAIVSDDGGLTFCVAFDEFQKPVTFPYMPPTTPEEVFIEYNEKTKKFVNITGNANKIKKLREKRKSEVE